MENHRIDSILNDLDIQPVNYGAATGATWGRIHTLGKELVSYSPVTGQPIASVIQAQAHDYEAVVSRASAAFEKFRMMPAPRRGEIVREIGNALRDKKQSLGALISM
ncbi:MAG TPA: aldehyde dehydrogenase family protein, partial [Desulfotignum sp.]|nr:aldehyde dehydrogenase family protein [Desulfotignum sp.]